MSRGLAEQIAVLDGLNGDMVSVYDQINASNGGNYSGGSNYPEHNPIPLMTSSVGLANLAADNDVIRAYDVLNASNGANYSGGSNYPENNPIPLMTSSVGLASMRGFADADLLAYANGVGQIPNTLPARMDVLDASGGANYSGGSSYAPGLPLLPSSAGLASVWNLKKIRQNPNQMHNLKLLQSLPPLARVKVLATSKAIIRAKRANDATSVARLRSLRNSLIKRYNPAATKLWK